MHDDAPHVDAQHRVVGLDQRIERLRRLEDREPPDQVRGTLYVSPPFVDTRSMFLTDFSGPIGPGFARVDFAVPNGASVVGVSFFGQAAVRDTAATRGWSPTQAVEVQVQ